jgi:hypothetical protein
MKRLLIGVGTVVFFLLVTAAIVYGLLRPEAEPNRQTTDPFSEISQREAPVVTSSSPEEALQSCYAWYLRGYVLSSDTLITKRTDSRFKDCFSEQFLRTWDTQLQTLGADPVVLAQGLLPTWETDVSVRVESRAEDSAILEIILGKDDDQYALQVAMVVEGSKWKVHGVRAADQDLNTH